MSFADVGLPFVLAACAAIYAILAGRAQASRLRGLQEAVSRGDLSGYLAIAILIVMILASLQTW